LARPNESQRDTIMNRPSAERFWSAPAADRGDLRKFGLLLAAVGAVVAGVAWYRHALPTAFWAMGIAGCFLVPALVWPPALRPLHAVWMLVARALGFVNSHLLLALVFYLLFTPMGLVMRLLGRDPLERRGFRPTAQSCRPGASSAPGSDGSAEPGSYWKQRDTPLLPRDHFERQF